MASPSPKVASVVSAESVVKGGMQSFAKIAKNLPLTENADVPRRQEISLFLGGVLAKRLPHTTRSSNNGHPFMHVER